jgi:hypothetical protein
MKANLLSFILSSALLGGAAFAQSSDGDHPRPRQPPEEAFTACSGLAEGDACTAKPRGHELKGQCTLGHESRLWCRPSGPPPGPPPSDDAR